MVAGVGTAARATRHSPEVPRIPFVLGVRANSSEAGADTRSGASRGKGHVSTDDEATRMLVKKAQSGDSDAFAAAFALHREKIERLCRRMLDDAASAEDATSEVFLRAHRSLSTYDSNQSFVPWLRKLATHYCIDQLRRRKTERTLFGAADRSTDDFADDAPSALLGIAHRQERHALLEALDQLPTKYRLPLVLRFYEDLDYHAMAEILGVSKGQVGTLLFRAKRQLRRALLADVGTTDAALRSPNARNAWPRSRSPKRSGKATQ